MNPNESDIIIIGAGLTGLTLAYFLKDRNYHIEILEARSRIGGRIETLENDDLAPLEMGATWLGKKHSALISLLQELDLEIFEQALGSQAIYEPISTSPPQLVHLPPNDEPSYRIKHGSNRLIQTLEQAINGNTHLLTNQPVTAIQERDNKMWVLSNDQWRSARWVVSTLPPYLLLKSIEISPALPESTQQIMQNTHTWMGESIKVGLFFKHPFWHKQNLSGTIFSNVGPIPEMYDHSNFEGTRHALKGFLNSTYYSLTKAQRLELILAQMRKYYGNAIEQFTEYAERVWRNEEFTYYPYEGHILPHQNNGHPKFQKPYFGNKFFIAGSETAPQFPGYMDGAIRSAKKVSRQIASLD